MEELIICMHKASLKAIQERMNIHKGKQRAGSHMTQEARNGEEKAIGNKRCFPSSVIKYMQICWVALPSIRLECTRATQMQASQLWWVGGERLSQTVGGDIKFWTFCSVDWWCIPTLPVSTPWLSKARSRLCPEGTIREPDRGAPCLIGMLRIDTSAHRVH